MVFIYYFLIISSKAKNSIFFLNEKHEITHIAFCNEKQGELTLTDIRSINFEDCLPLIYI